MLKRIASNLWALVDMYLQQAFPPVLDKRLDATSAQYHERINRKGVFRPLNEVAGVTIVRQPGDKLVIEGQAPPPPPQSGTRAAREAAREQY